MDRKDRSDVALKDSLVAQPWLMRHPGSLITPNRKCEISVHFREAYQRFSAVGCSGLELRGSRLQKHPYPPEIPWSFASQRFERGMIYRVRPPGFVAIAGV
jgi:hypothetical protein